MDKKIDYQYLDIITEKLISYGLSIYELRKKFIDDINEYIGMFYKKIFETGEIKVKYVSDFKKNDKNVIKENYQKNYEREINFGKTLYGIHHDDIEFILDEKNIAICGSNGQQKNAILSFKLAEIEVIKKNTHKFPILILDDLFSALDTKKIKNIFKLLDNKSQIFITTTELTKIDKKLIENATLFKLDNGAFKEG